MPLYLAVRGSVGFGVALMSSFIGGCTLTSEPWDPLEASAPLQPMVEAILPDAGPPPPEVVEPEPPPPPDPCPGASELSGCEVELLPGQCRLDGDCESLHCSDGRCQPASCDDGRRNQDESATDCGGGCDRCAIGASCREGTDCATGVCGDDGTCAAPSCDDGAANGDEPGVDCGNAACGPCPVGSTCSTNAQCASSRCEAGSCRPPQCEDGARNGAESDVDCGGTDPGCARCAAGDGCRVNADCASGRCLNGACSSCGDGVRNGTETDIDCGGACGPCGTGRGCNVDTDCQSAACQDGLCCGGTREHCTRCARRLAGVLSCSSNGPFGAVQCDAFLDCLADNSEVCSVRYAPGCSDVPGGVCNPNAFGGNSGPGVALADAILGTAACTFGEE